jgi:ribosomal protein S18 acetylase RimI-like enzyme
MGAPAITIREMEGYDVAPLAEALGLARRHIERRWSEALFGFRDAYVAEVDGRPVGTVSTSEREELPGCLHLSALEVAPALQSRGIGTQLIACVEDKSRERSMAGVYLDVAIDNEDARRLYERLGYVAHGDPFVASWDRYDPDRRTFEKHSETMQRVVKRF